MKLWSPTQKRIENANVTRFEKNLFESHKLKFNTFHDLYDWSIRDNELFWREASRFLGLPLEEPVIKNKLEMPGASFFPNASLNFASKLLSRRDNHKAIVFWGEEKTKKTYSYAELFKASVSFANFLRSVGVKEGERVAGIVANTPETIACMLGTSAIGAIWTSCSPDFGVTGVIDRFGQVEPTVIVATDGYYFKGEWIDCTSKLIEILNSLPSIKAIVVLPYGEKIKGEISGIKNSYDWISIQSTATEFLFPNFKFSHPLYIMYSSGTTGKPKCIVHSAGGTLLEHLKELVLHCDLKPHDSIFYQTTCGWMMWNFLVSSLAVGATVILYDGSPMLQKGSILFDLADETGITIFGTNAKYIALLEKEGVCPKKTHSLSTLHTMLSTGSPLLPESFDYVYRDIKDDLLLASISGGTDIIGCFALGSPTLPVHKSELQTRSLGLSVDVFNEKGAPIKKEKGELVCKSPFPSMPIGFWNDPEGKRYRSAYFERFPGIWHHGDFVELTENNGMIFYGRSDAVLNPGGVRIGTAEIYRQVETLDEIVESLAIGQNWENDVRVVLFVRLKEGVKLSEDLISEIKSRVKSGASPFHVPKKIIAVPDIPRTRSGKIVEIAVRDIIHGIEPKNIEALLNPEALSYFRNIPELSKP